MMKNIADFKDSLSADTPPATLSVYLKALWYDGKGDWNAAHHLVDSLEDKTACWVHAYLHRKEGDIWNADYWYRRAGRTRPAQTLEQEWAHIVNTLMDYTR